MLSMMLFRNSARWIFGALLLVIAAAMTPHLEAQQTAPQKRDSVARADSMRRAMQGMKGMKMPAKKRAPKKPTTTAGKRKPTATAKAKSKTMPRMKPVAPMSGMTHAAAPSVAKPSAKDTTPMTGMPGMKPGPAPSRSPTMSMPSTRSGDTASMAAANPRSMMIPDPLGISMDRLGSGTTWIPDAISLPSRRFVEGHWNVMVHGFLFGQYDKQNGPRGDSQFGSLNWAMIMASHELAGGRFQARTMLSLDAAGVTARGYPLLLQSGESYRGQPLHDRQHPHDFWMELAAMYERPIVRNIGLLLYAAPSGEPALGPVAFMHRPSAMDNPTAPIAHHWQDATHVSFGVVTAGLFSHDWKLEGSVFNGREPDEHRWNFDPIKFDSYSGRFSFNPSRTWALSAGYGYMKSPEALHPDESMHRLTASAMHGVSIGADGQWASELVWGANSHSSHPGLAHSVTLETEAILDRHNTVLGRAEYVRKSAEDLALDGPPSNFPAAQSFNVEALSLGYIRELSRVGVTTIGLGGMATLNVVPRPLESPYGSRTPIGTLIFLRLRPFHQHSETQTMGGMKMR